MSETEKDVICEEDKAYLSVTAALLEGLSVETVRLALETAYRMGRVSVLMEKVSV